MTNKLIIEGAWGTGKTAVTRVLKEKYGYQIIREPDHLKISDSVADPDSWYIEQHGKNFENMLSFPQEKKAVMERSIISSMAFLYASGKDIDLTKEPFKRFQKWFSGTETLVVVLYSKSEKSLEITKELRDFAVKNLLTANSGFMEKLDYFYRTILPFEYKIAPLFIDIFNQSGQRKTADEIVENINTAIQKNRIAQANVVCFRMSGAGAQFLVLKRNKQKGEFWQTITGGIHMKGLLDENTLREVAEETSIKTNSANLIPTKYNFNYIGGEGYELNEYVYGYRLGENDQIALSSEHTASSMLSADEAIGLVKYDGNKVAIKKVSEAILAASR